MGSLGPKVRTGVLGAAWGIGCGEQPPGALGCHGESWGDPMDPARGLLTSHEITEEGRVPDGSQQ